jgi:hypothetical protein
MRRLVSLLVVTAAIAGCTWPPKPSVPSAPAPNTGEAADDASGALSGTQAPDVRAPRIAPPAMSVPRLGATGGSLLRR